MTVIKSSLEVGLIKFADNNAIVTESYKLSYSQLANSVVQTIENLKKCNIISKKQVAIISNNSAEQIILIFALWQLKIVTALISVRNPKEVIADQIKVIKATAVFVENKTELKNSILISDVVKISNNHDTALLFEELDSNQKATLIFTSGSSSKPKAVMHTIGSLYYSAKGSNENLPLHQIDRWLLSLPIYHVGGLGILLRSLLVGAAIVIPSQNYKLSDTIATTKITHLSLVATQLNRLLTDNNHKKLSSLKAILLGGSMIPSQLIKEAMAVGLPIYKSYGMTEMASQICTTKKLSSVVKHSGKILPYREIKLSDKNEILVKGKTLFKGYFQNGELSKPLDVDGFFKTGDIGQFDNDNYLIVTGRIDNQFISGGENISPEEIENLIFELFEFENVVVVPVANEEFGQRPAVFLLGKFDQNKIRTKLKAFLPSYKIPDYYFEYPQDLTESSIKPSRNKLKQLAEKLIRD